MNQDPYITTILALTLKSGVFLGAVFFLLATLRRFSAAAQSIVLRASLVSLLLLPVIGAFTPWWELKTDWSPFNPNLTKAPAVSPSAAAVPTDGPGRSETDPGPTSPTEPKALPFVTWIWACGFSACLLRFLLGWVRMAVLRKTAAPVASAARVRLELLTASFGLKRQVTLAQHPSCQSPLCFGFLRPVIFLPEDHHQWSEEETGMILAHELTHIQRSDAAFLWLGEITRALFWMNPLIWVALRQLRKADERAADDAALRAAPTPAAYAGLLAGLVRKAIHQPGFSRAASIGMARASLFRQRVERILDPSQRRHRPGSRMAFTLISPLLITAALLAGGEFVRADQNASGHTALLKEKLNQIILPEISLEKASLSDSIRTLEKLSRANDPNESNPKKKGIKFLLETESQASINMELKDIPLGEAVRLLTGLAAVDFRIDPAAISIIPTRKASAPSANDEKAAPGATDPLFSRSYHLPSNFLGKQALADLAGHLKQAAGMTMPNGASTFYNRKSESLTIRNTAANVKRVDSYIDGLTKKP
ncbi:MAG: M56 family metallopeptidase [Verrucomicrobiota bacterium]